MQQKQVLKMTEYEIAEDCYTKLLNMDNIKEVHLEILYMSKVIDLDFLNMIQNNKFLLKNCRCQRRS
jgi:hypothetical protein